MNSTITAPLKLLAYTLLTLSDQDQDEILVKILNILLGKSGLNPSHEMSYSTHIKFGR